MYFHPEDGPRPAIEQKQRMLSQQVIIETKCRLVCPLLDSQSVCLCLPQESKGSLSEIARRKPSSTGKPSSISGRSGPWLCLSTETTAAHASAHSTYTTPSILRQLDSKELALLYSHQAKQSLTPPLL